MKAFFGILLIVVGIAVAGLFGVWGCLISGIINLCHIGHAMLTHQSWSANELAWGIIRVVLGNAISFFVGGLLMLAGFGILSIGPARRFSRF